MKLPVTRNRLAAGLASSLSVAFLLLAAGNCRADVPTAAEECRLRQAAICELRGLQYVVDGPCPPAATTVRPPGRERCDEASPVGVAPARSSPPATSEVAAPPRTTDLAWVGRLERWLLPTLLVAAGVLLAALCILALCRRRAQREADTARPGVVRLLLQFLAAAALAVPLAYQAAGLAFQRVFSGADNHDSVAPWLLAAPVGLVVFVLVAGITFALAALLLGYLFTGLPKGQGSDPSGRRDDE